MINTNKQAKDSKKRSIVLIVVPIALVLIFVAGAIFMTVSHNKSRKNLNDVGVVISMVQKHYLLPVNEQPALATITDPSKLTTKFLKNTRQGDKLLIYQKASKVIIYRPSIDRVVDVGPVQISNISQPQ